MPLLPFIFPAIPGPKFVVSSVATAITFVLIGMAKGHVVHRSKLISGLETLVIGAIAASLAYFVGVWLGDIAR